MALDCSKRSNWRWYTASRIKIVYRFKSSNLTVFMDTPKLKGLHRSQRAAIKCLLDHPGSYVLVIDDYTDMTRQNIIYDDQGNEYLSVISYLVQALVKRNILINPKTISRCTTMNHTYIYLNPQIKSI